jgi:hypothetical protein
MDKILSKNNGANSAKPILNKYMLKSIQDSAQALIAEIHEIDYLLLTYKRELVRAQVPINCALVLNFLPTKNANNFGDNEPVMARFIRKNDGSWMIRELRVKPGELHLARVVGKSGSPLEQDGIVRDLLKEIDKLLQARKTIVALCRPIRQTANGILKGAEKTRRIATEKVDKLSEKIHTDWSNPSASTIAATQRQDAKEARAKRKTNKKLIATGESVLVPASW